MALDQYIKIIIKLRGDMSAAAAGPIFCLNFILKF
jgi:hypothetical protein